MFKRLRIQFIAIASLSILLVLFAIVGVINTARRIQTNNELFGILTLISKNGGALPNPDETTTVLGDRVSADMLYQYRFYSGVFDKDKELSSYDASNISGLSNQEVVKNLEMVLGLGQKQGIFNSKKNTYAYLLTTSSSTKTLVVVMDITNQTEDDRLLLNLSLWISGVGFVFFVFLVTIFSGRVIAPFVRNYEQQKRFITNAGHELKTPLAIIAANNELVELMNGESEWTKSTGDQVARLTGLINGLVSLARLEEQPKMVLADVNFSEIAEDAAEDFKGPVVRDGKTFHMDIQPDIVVKAESKSLFELVTLLVDNATKYCDEGGQVSVRLTKSNRLSRAKLEISNTYKEGADVDYSKFFERFYREDESHNSQTAGYGIGLSMAQSMVKLFKGTLSVNYKGQEITFVVTI